MDQRELWRADGPLVIRLRTERGWGREQLAQAAGVSPHTVKKIERGGSVFPATLSHVAAALGVTAEAIRASAEAPPRIPRSRRRLIDAVDDLYRVYNEATRSGDLDLLCGEMARRVNRTVRWSFAATRDFELTGDFSGRDGVLRFFRTSLAICRRQEDMRPETLDLLAGRNILCRHTDRLIVAGIGLVTASCLHLFEFDRRGRIVRFHQSADVLSVESEDGTHSKA